MEYLFVIFRSNPNGFSLRGVLPWSLASVAAPSFHLRKYMPLPLAKVKNGDRHN
jgi:hypothetical protein